MSNFRCSVLAHSVNPVGDEAVTFELCYERFIHSEFMTHRWSRNASSSRAIPFKRMLEWTLEDPAMPLHYGANRKGMQSGGEVEDREACRSEILDMLDYATIACRPLVAHRNLHKEVVNRYLEPWGWINVLATMGRRQLMNFFKLRMDKHAHPNMQRLAVSMARSYRASTPRRLAEGEWHLPYITEEERDGQYRVWFDNPTTDDTLIVWSVARCAWVSYQTVDGKEASWDDAKRRHDECVRLKHVTPCEPQLRARADHGQSGCVPGFDSYRSMIADERCDDFDYESLLDTVYAVRDYVVPE